MDNQALIDRAAQTLRPHTDADGRRHGDVASAVLSEADTVHVGVCVDTFGWGLCAERSALAAMITAGHYRFEKIVAVWRHDETGELHAVAPCGICRNFMQQIDQGNLRAQVILPRGAVKTLAELVPHHDWPA